MTQGKGKTVKHANWRNSVFSYKRCNAAYWDGLEAGRKGKFREVPYKYQERHEEGSAWRKGYDVARKEVLNGQSQ